MLAHYPEKRRNDQRTLRIGDRNRNVASALTALKGTLETVGEGVAFDDAERLDRLRFVRASVLNNDTALGATGVSVPINRFRDDRFTQDPPQNVLKVATDIEPKLLTIKLLGSAVLSSNFYHWVSRHAQSIRCVVPWSNYDYPTGTSRDLCLPDL